MRASDPSSKALVFTQYNSTLEWLKAALPAAGFDYRSITGSMPLNQRTKAIEVGGAGRHALVHWCMCVLAYVCTCVCVCVYVYARTCVTTPVQRLVECPDVPVLVPVEDRPCLPLGLC